MKARRMSTAWGLVAAVLLAWAAWGATSVQAQTPEPLEASLREQVMAVPAGGLTEPSLEVTVFLPPGAGPFPVAVINHGRAPGADARQQSRYRPLRPAREFVRRGYAVVVPMRQGFSRSGGMEIQGGCNVHSNGLAQARSVRRTLDWLGTQPWADVSRNVVLGQSHGGLTTLAYGTDPHPGTRLLVNFAGGLRQESCAGWEFNLQRAIGEYGTQTRLPSLWFYGDNDSYFQPFLWKGAHERYVQGGGRAELIAFGVFATDAHGMFGSAAGQSIWVGPVMAALESVGMPVRVVAPAAGSAAEDVTPPPPSGFAAVDDIERLPLTSTSSREGYRAWLAAASPKAYAIHAGKGTWGSAWGGERPYARALANCERHARQPCTLYAVDDAVVWKP